MEKKIDVLVRAIIVVNGKIVVCRKKNKRYYFFPGGHIEFGESAKKALKREIKEELGLRIKKSSFIGCSEHSFIEDGKKYHEINLIFYTEVNKEKIESKEEYLQFFLFDKKELIKQRVLPQILKNSVLRWFRNKKIFWTSEWR
ncbi:NUDIX domain-containing protein [bacterium]|nr:NUDIX domain-containing protein [bacterium]